MIPCKRRIINNNKRRVKYFFTPGVLLFSGESTFLEVKTCQIYLTLANSSDRKE